MPLFLPSVPLSGGTLTGPLVIGGGTVTASTPILNLTQTWNNGSVSFVGVNINVVNDASAITSLPFRVQVGGSDILYARRDGFLRVFGAMEATGNIIVGSALYLGNTSDVALQRSAAGVLDLRNGANAQTFQVFGTYTDASNYRRLRTTMTTGGAATIAAEGLGTGVSGNTLAFAVGTGGSPTTVFTIDGTLLTFADAKNVVFNATTGTKLGTATTQKLGFWNATPIVQPSSTGETVGFTAGGGTTVTDASTFTGNVGATAYRISDIVKALKNSGLMAS